MKITIVHDNDHDNIIICQLSDSDIDRIQHDGMAYQFDTMIGRADCDIVITKE